MMDFEIKIVNIHEFRGDHVYVGRGSPLGNPFSSIASNFEVFKVKTREEAIEKYKAWLEEKLKYSSPQNKAISECVEKILSDKTITLGCFCAHHRCHAEIIADVLRSKVAKIQSEWKGLFE